MSDLLALATTRRQSRANLHATWLDGGSLEIYSGSRPADPETAITDQVLLAVFTLADPAVSDVTDGVITGDLPAATLILDTGQAAWARSYDSLDAVIWDADVGATGSGEAVEVDNVSFLAGAYAAVTAITITEG